MGGGQSVSGNVTPAELAIFKAIEAEYKSQVAELGEMDDEKLKQLYAHLSEKYQAKLAELGATPAASAPTEEVPKKIVAIFGATGKAGSRIQTEILNRGHRVVAIVRDASKVSAAENLTIVAISGVDEVAAALSGCTTLVHAYAPPVDAVGELIPVTRKLIDAVKSSGVERLVMVGGAGGLQAAPGSLVINQPWFPNEYRAIAQAHIDALEVMRTADISWTTLSPPVMFAPGERTGKYRLGTEDLVSTEAGSSISMEDYAIAIADEIEKPRHERMRFSCGN
jgi:putative NADH-flavin reductase